MVALTLIGAVAAMQPAGALPYAARFTCDVSSAFLFRGRRSSGPGRMIRYRYREAITIPHWSEGSEVDVRRQDSRSSLDRTAHLLSARSGPGGQLHVALDMPAAHIRLDRVGRASARIAYRGSSLVMDAGTSQLTGSCAADIREPAPGAPASEERR